MKPARMTVGVVVSALVVLAGCNSGSPSRSRAAGGAVRSETTTTSSTTTTTTNMTATTRFPAQRVAAGGVTADCPGGPPLEGARGSADRNSLRMVSAQKGFAVDDTAIVVTDDGRTWTRRYSGSDPMFSVDAVDPDHAWAVGQQILMATSDGGRSWQPVGEPDQGMLRVVDFIDAQNGWGVTGNHVFRTVDGGRTWQHTDPPCGGEAVCFTGPDDGWAATGPNVYRTTNGGDSWQPAFTVPVDDLDSPFNSQSVHGSQLRCARPGVAWVYFTGRASGSHIAYAAYRGTAAGEWTPVMKEPEAGPRAVHAPAGGTDPGPMWALGADSAMYVSFTPLAGPPANLTLREATDGGRRLGPARPIQGVFSATSISFLSPEVGWVLGAKAGSSAVDAILATTDGGQTWQEQYTYAVPPPAG